MAIINGTAGDDIGPNGLVGTNNDDQIFGLEGNDHLFPFGGNDFVDGGPGDKDTAYYFTAGGPIAGDLGVGLLNDGDGGTDTLVGIEIVIGSEFGDSLTGSADPDSFQGGPGDDFFDGAAELDTFILQGSVEDYDFSTGIFGENQITDTNPENGDEGTDTLENVEFIQFGGQFGFDVRPISSFSLPLPPQPPTILGDGASNINLDGAVTSFIDFGGQDTFTVLPLLGNDVEIIDNNATTILLPPGMEIESARFLADGVQMEINGNNLTLLGSPVDFTFVFGGTPLDPSAGTSLTFEETAAAFGASIPDLGEAPVEATVLGLISNLGVIDELF